MPYQAHGTIHRRYRPLLRFLEALPAEQAAIRLSVRDLRTILGPSSAPTERLMPTWSADRVADAFRQRAGFAAHYDRTDRSITFTRQAVGSRPLQEA